MNAGVYLLKPLWPYSSVSFFWRLRLICTALGRTVSERFSFTATKASKGSAARPSVILRLACLALGISAYLGLQAPPTEEDPQLTSLAARGWSPVEGSPCPGLEPGNFYEAESESESREFYYLGAEQTLSARPPPWPEGELRCRKISHPSHVQEIQ